MLTSSRNLATAGIMPGVRQISPCAGIAFVAVRPGCEFRVAAAAQAAQAPKANRRQAKPAPPGGPSQTS